MKIVLDVQNGVEVVGGGGGLKPSPPHYYYTNRQYVCQTRAGQTLKYSIYRPQHDLYSELCINCTVPYLHLMEQYLCACCLRTVPYTVSMPLARFVCTYGNCASVVANFLKVDSYFYQNNSISKRSLRSAL
jgi:hypothetical protein